MKRVVFRADDLGYSEAVNYGIEKALQSGLVKSVGVMVNMPSTQHGLDLIKSYDVALSVHVNICVGKPLTDPERIPSLVDEAGNFKSSSVYRQAQEDFLVLEEVLLEIEAQYNRFCQLVGRKPDYFEGHAIRSANFLKGLAQTATKYDLKYSKLATTPNEEIRVGASRVQVHMGSMYPDYDPLEMVKRVVLGGSESLVHLFVFHPGYLDAAILEQSSLTIPRTQEVKMLSGQTIQQFLKEEKVQVLDYRDL